jgi:hypothetical protein
LGQAQVRRASFRSHPAEIKMHLPAAFKFETALFLPLHLKWKHDLATLFTPPVQEASAR